MHGIIGKPVLSAVPGHPKIIFSGYCFVPKSSEQQIRKFQFAQNEQFVKSDPHLFSPYIFEYNVRSISLNKMGSRAGLLGKL